MRILPFSLFLFVFFENMLITYFQVPISRGVLTHSAPQRSGGGVKRCTQNKTTAAREQTSE